MAVLNMANYLNLFLPSLGDFSDVYIRRKIIGICDVIEVLFCSYSQAFSEIFLQRRGYNLVPRELFHISTQTSSNRLLGLTLSKS